MRIYVTQIIVIVLYVDEGIYITQILSIVWYVDDGNIVIIIKTSLIIHFYNKKW